MLWRRAVVMLHVAGHRVGPMVMQLSIEPGVQGIDKLRIRRVICQLRAAFDVLVVDGDLARLGRPECRQPGHVAAMNVCRSGEVSSQEPCLEIVQVRAHEIDLFLVIEVPGNDTLRPAIGRNGRTSHQ